MAPAPPARLTEASRRGAERAAEHLPALTRAYGRALRAAGRRAAARMRQAEPLQAAANPKEPPNWVPPPAGALIDAAELAADAERKTGKLHRAILSASAAESLQPFGLSFDIHAPASQAALQQFADRIAATIQTAIAEQITEATQAGYANGDSVYAVSQAIRRATDEISRPRADMLARSDLNGLANSGSLLAASISGAAATKTWLATEDERTRETHAEADGQTVGINDSFDVGGESALYPGDPSLSWEEAANCRCTLTYGEPLTAAAEPRAAEPRDFASWADYAWEGDPEKGRRNIPVLFRSPLPVLADGGPDVSNFAMVAVYPQPSEAEAIALPDGHAPEKMHVTLLFLGEADSFDHAEVRAALDEVARQGEPLAGTVGGVGRFAAGPDGAPLIALPDVKGLSGVREAVAGTLAARGIESPSEHGWLPHLTLDYIGENDAMPPPDCLGAPLTFDSVSFVIADQREDYPFANTPDTAVTSGGNMSLMLPTDPPKWGSLTADEALAAIRARLAVQGADGILEDDELRAIILAVQAFALSASEPAALELRDVDLTAAAAGGTQWQATLCTAGEPTVDSGIKRLLVEGGGSWLPLPLPLGLLDDTPHADMTTKSPVVGRIDQIWMAGNICQASGVFFDDSDDPSLQEQAGKAAALVGEMRRMGISVDLVDIDVEMMVWDGGGIAEAPLDALNDPTAPDEPLSLPLDMPEAQEEESEPDADDSELIYAFKRWVIGGATICPVQALTQATICLVASGFRGPNRYRWFSLGLLERGALTASAAGLAPARPPRAWFEVPESGEPTPLMVTDEGQVFGHMGLWNTCHTGFAGQCVPPPKSPSDYAGFHTGEIPLADGSRLAVGTLTMDTGHAGKRLSAERAVAHYDDTGTAAAYVRASDGRFGIWVAGALSARLDAGAAQALMAAKPSGDWREIFRGRGRDMIGALMVNVPGFVVPRTLVAAGMPGGVVAVEFSSVCPPCEEALARELAVEAASADGIAGLAALVEA